jgi:hypothetical protein
VDHLWRYVYATAPRSNLCVFGGSYPQFCAWLCTHAVFRTRGNGCWAFERACCGPTRAARLGGTHEPLTGSLPTHYQCVRAEFKRQPRTHNTYLEPPSERCATSGSAPGLLRSGVALPPSFQLPLSFHPTGLASTQLLPDVPQTLASTPFQQPRWRSVSAQLPPFDYSSRRV